MLSARTGKILNTIVEHYIVNTVPVPSQRIARDLEMGVSPATIRNEMAYLEQEGYLIRPHTSAGCIPSDKGYRYYVEALENMLYHQLFNMAGFRYSFHIVKNVVRDVWS